MVTIAIHILSSYRTGESTCSFVGAERRETSPIEKDVLKKEKYQTDNINSFKNMKNKTTAGVLAIFLGGIGAHKFYLGQNGLGLLYLVFVWTFIPAILGLVEGLSYFSLSDEDFNKKYNGIEESTKENKAIEITTKETTEERKRCPYCAELILEKAIKCKHCQSDLSTKETH